MSSTVFDNNLITNNGELVASSYKVPADRVTYNYRYFLPYPPSWGSIAYCRQRLRELLVFCGEAEIDAVQFFVNQMPHTIGTPARSAEEQLEWAAWMRDEVAPVIRSANMSYQLNFQLILGHGGLGIDMSDEYDWEYLVSHDGGVGEGCACPIGPKFREKMGAMIRLWAGTSPDVLWIDDDFRMHNHRISKSGDMDYYCFCDRHLKLFADQYGKQFTREYLVAEISKPGTPSIWRRRWQEFISDGMVDTARWIRNEISSVSPNIRTALMTSLPDTHSMEGRDWKKTLNALSGEHAPMVRPCCGSYSSNIMPLKNNTVTFQMFEQSMELLNKGVGYKGIDFAPELENARFTTWANSVSHSQYVLTLAQLLGCPHITLSLHDLDGSPLSEEPTNVSMLKSIKPDLEVLASMNLASWDKLGLAFICDPGLGGKYEYESGETLGNQPIVRPFENMLVQVGVPCCYVSPCEATDYDGIVVLDRSTAWSLSDEQLKRLLHGAVMLDSSSAAVMQQRGYGEYLGVEICESMEFGIHSEIYHNDILPGVYACRVPHMGMNWRRLKLKGATAASDYVDTKYRFYTGSTIFKNSLGGKVAVFANVGNCEPYAEWANHARIRHLHGIISCLSDNTFPLLPKMISHGLSLVRRRKQNILIALANFSADIIQESGFKLCLTDRIDRIQVLDGASWEDINADVVSGENNYVEVSFKKSWAPNKWVILNVSLKS